MFGNGNGQRGGIDGEVLAELRAIRQEIAGLSERVALAASREDLKGYVTQQQFEDHVKGHDGKTADWRWWASFGLSCLAALLALHAAGVGLILR